MNNPMMAMMQMMMGSIRGRGRGRGMEFKGRGGYKGPQGGNNNSAQGE